MQAEKEIITYREALIRSMDEGLAHAEHVIIMGQGVDDHKGTFGTTLGLAEKYGADRVFDIPLSEEGNTGIAIGAALNGLYPIQTHIRSDFGLLAMNQIINIAAKYKYMYGGTFEVPFLIRMVIGRSWGQGAQHSQSLQSLFGHIPGLTVIMPASADSVLSSYKYAIEKYRGPVISLEHRLLYEVKFKVNEQEQQIGNPFTSFLIRPGNDVTIVATSVMVIEAQRAAEYLEKYHSINCEIIDLHSISHFDKKMILDSVQKTGRLIVADTSWKSYGVAAEISRIVCEHNPPALKAGVLSFGMAPSPCPTSKPLEDLFYPNTLDVIKGAVKLVTGKDAPLDSAVALAGLTIDFKGPF